MYSFSLVSCISVMMFLAFWTSSLRPDSSVYPVSTSGVTTFFLSSWCRYSSLTKKSLVAPGPPTRIPSSSGLSRKTSVALSATFLKNSWAAISISLSKRTDD